MLFAVFEINFDVLELYRYDVFIHVVCIVWILFIYVEQYLFCLFQCLILFMFIHIYIHIHIKIFVSPCNYCYVFDLSSRLGVISRIELFLYIIHVVESVLFDLFDCAVSNLIVFFIVYFHRSLCLHEQEYRCIFKVILNVNHTKHAAHETQIERQEEKKSYTHDTDSQKQANRQGMCIRETEAIMGKAPRLGIHAPYHQLGASRADVL